MNSFSDRARLVIIIAILFVSSQVARILPLAEGWMILAAGATATILGLAVDQWGRRRGPHFE